MQIQLKNQRLLIVTLLGIISLLKTVKECVDQTGAHVCNDNTGKEEPER